MSQNKFLTLKSITAQIRKRYAEQKFKQLKTSLSVFPDAQEATILPLRERPDGEKLHFSKATVTKQLLKNVSCKNGK